MKTARKATLEITWLGHAAFLLVPDSGPRILLDPYRAPDAGTYAPLQITADIVLASHLNAKYHSFWKAASGAPVRLNGLDAAAAPDGITVQDVRFKAVQVWESAERTVPVSMPYFELGGLSVCHSGDLGHALTPEEAAPIQGIDVFLAVAGGPPTVTLPDLKATIDLIQPRLVLPMHYQNGKSSLPILPIDDFLALFAPSQISHRESPTLTLRSEDLPPEMQVIVMPSAC